MNSSFIACFDKNNEYKVYESNLLKSYMILNKDDRSKQIHGSGFSTNPKDIVQPEYDPNKLADLLDLNIYHKRCCKIISQDSAGSNYDLTHDDYTEDNEEEYNRICDFIDNLDEPINLTLQKMLFDLKSLGNGAIEIIRTDGEITGLKYLPTLNLRRTQDGKRFVQEISNNKVWFVQYGKNYDENDNECDVDCRTGDFKSLGGLADEDRANEILFVKEHNAKSEFYGSPDIVGAIPSIHNDVSCVEYNTNFFKNYGVPAFLLSVVGDYTEEPQFIDGEPNPYYSEKNTVKYQIEKQLKEIIKNPHSAMVLLLPTREDGEDGKVEVKVERLSTDQKEGSFLLYRQDTRNEVINAYGIPNYMLGIQETGTLGGSNIEIATQNYKQGVILPIRASIENLINKLLVNELEMNYYRFTIVETDNRDYEKEIDLLMKLFKVGCITPAQIIDNVGKRFNLDYESVKNNPYMNKYYINNVPIDIVNENADIDELMTDNQVESVIPNLIGGLVGKDKENFKDKVSSIIKN